MAFVVAESGLLYDHLRWHSATAAAFEYSRRVNMRKFLCKLLYSLSLHTIPSHPIPSYLWLIIFSALKHRNRCTTYSGKMDSCIGALLHGGRTNKSFTHFTYSLVSSSSFSFSLIFSLRSPSFYVSILFYFVSTTRLTLLTCHHKLKSMRVMVTRKL